MYKRGSKQTSNKLFTVLELKNMIIFEPRREKTGLLPMRKKRRRSASQ